MPEGRKLRRDTGVTTEISKKQRETLLQLKGETMRTKKIFPYHLQFFAEGNGEGTQQGSGESGTQTNVTTQANRTVPEIDYEKLASVIEGKQKVAEDTVLKNYLKQQGLTGEELNSAIQTYKSEKAKNTPDVNALQSELKNAQQVAVQAKLEQQATLAALTLGIDMKTIPYVLKLADLSVGVDNDGKVDEASLKQAIGKVLEDLPQLKQNNKENEGFQIGAGTSQQNQNTDEQLNAIFGV